MNTNLNLEEYENTVIGKYLLVISENNDIQTGINKIYGICQKAIDKINVELIPALRKTNLLWRLKGSWADLIEQYLSETMNELINEELLKYRWGLPGKQEKDIHCDKKQENIILEELSFYGLDPNNSKSYSIEVKTTYNGSSCINNDVKYAKEPEIEGGKVKKSFYIFIYYDLPSNNEDIKLKKVQFSFLEQKDWHYLKKNGTEQSHSYIRINELREQKKLLDVIKI